MADVFPRRNLNKSADPWGRDIEAVTMSNAERIENHERRVSGDNRAIAGQMGSVGRQVNILAGQVEELAARVSNVIQVPNVSVTATSTTSFSSGSSSATIPGVGESPRNAIIIVSGFPAYDTSGTFAGPFITIRFAGQIVFQGRVMPAVVGSAPGGWSDTFDAALAVTVPNGGATLQIQMQAQLFTAGNKTATIRDIKATVLFSDPT